MASGELNKANKQLTVYREIIGKYASHQSWRCGYPDRYPWDDPQHNDCPCGLVKALREAGLPKEWADL